MTTAHAEWPHQKDIAINPAKRKKLLATLIGLGAAALLLLNQDRIINHFVDAHRNALIRPAMSALAEQGKPDAVVWMMEHDAGFASADPQFSALRKAADSGHPQSMYLYSKVLKWQHDELAAQNMLAKAAEQGFPPAVLDLARQAE